MKRERKINHALMFIFILGFSIFLFSIGWIASIGINKITGNALFSTHAVRYCIDVDNGYRAFGIYNQSNAISAPSYNDYLDYYGNKRERSEDTCISSMILAEAICTQDNYTGYKNYTCEYGCDTDWNGRCKTLGCVDLDKENELGRYVSSYAYDSLYDSNLNGDAPFAPIDTESSFSMPYHHTLKDYCASSTILSEAVCRKDSGIERVTFVNYSCAYGCENGKCRDSGCSDSDVLSSQFIKTNTYNLTSQGLTDFSGTDSCEGEFLLEYSCEGNNVKTNLLSCPSGSFCSQGICETVTSICNDLDVGPYDIYIASTVELFKSGELYDYDWDICANAVSVDEHYCKSSKGPNGELWLHIESTRKYCPDGEYCSQGRCISLNPVGSLQINSTPADAKIYLDNNYIGMTNYQTEIKAGNYSIQLLKEGYLNSTFIVNVSNFEVTSLNVLLDSVQYCKDYDKGASELTTFSNVTIYDSLTNVILASTLDKCSNNANLMSDYLEEASCFNNALLIKQILCSNGCENGVCKNSTTASTCFNQGGTVCQEYEVCQGSQIFNVDSNRCCRGICKIPDSFDWRNRHGENWNSPVKNQLLGSTCWAFALTGAFETQLNLYYNQHLNVDLSEQNYIDCFIEDQDNFTDELCGPYAQRNQNSRSVNGECFNRCENYKDRTWAGNDRIRLDEDEEYNQILLSDTDYKKKLILDGPFTQALYVLDSSGAFLSFTPISHAMVLEGYFIKDNETFWIYKNSWGADNLNINTGNWDAGYWALSNVTEYGKIHYLFAFNGPFISPFNPAYWPADFDNSIKCVDKDEDSFCNWGISKVKPSTCPSYCQPEKDWDDSDNSIFALGIENVGEDLFLLPVNGFIDTKSEASNFFSADTSEYMLLADVNAQTEQNSNNQEINNLECTADSQCSVQEIELSITQCDIFNRDVVQEKKVPVCREGKCLVDSTWVVAESCQNGCEDGMCKTITCVTSQDCLAGQRCIDSLCVEKSKVYEVISFFKNVFNVE